MTREEQIINAAENYYKDSKLKDLKILHFINGANWADETMIDKVCEWLNKRGYFVNNKETLEDFRKAMEK